MNRPFTSLVKKILTVRGGRPEAFLVFQRHPESSAAPLVAVTRTEFNARATEKAATEVKSAKYLRAVTVGWQDDNVWDHLD